MASQPSPHEIHQIREFTSISESEAVTLLKKHNNDTERAIQAYFEDPVAALKEDGDPRRWEYQDNIPSFRIDADDTSTGALPAMSRPPSRADRIIHDLSTEHAQAAANVNKTPQEQDEEADLQRAINLSLNQDAPAQENGVTGTGQQFGPALKPHYETSNWSLVPVATLREIVEHPPPAKRRRIEGQPAFLRGSKETGYLGSLLTIYHGIPLAREALLLPPLDVHAYGYVPDWWSGSSDENRKSLSFEANQQTDNNRLNLLAEVQCLMAFLDNTKRAYGSVDALADLYALRTYQPESPFSRFLEAWRAAALGECPQEQLTQIFSSIAMKGIRPEDSPISKYLVCLEPPVNRIEGQVLVDLLDVTVWNDNLDLLDDVWISHTAEVFTIHMYDPVQKDEGLQLTTSTVWYPDRYMYHCRDITRQMRHEMQLIRKEIHNYSTLQRRCKFIWSPDKKTVPIKDVLEAASKSSSAAMTNRFSASGANEEIAATEFESMQPDVQALLGRIEEKVDALEDRKVELQIQMRKIAHQMTQPSDDPSQPPFNKYDLQGVATKPDILYLRRRNPDLLGLEEDETVSREEWQWWRIVWSNNKATTSFHPPMIGPLTQAQVEAAKETTNGTSASEDDRSAPYVITKVSEQDVIDAVKTEHNAVVMVYANQNAMKFQSGPLSQGLRHFVNQDNVMFERECRDEVREAGWAPEEGFENIPLDENANNHSSDREMTPMSVSGPFRDDDGQPSPKRPKSSDVDWKPMDEHPPSYEDSLGQPEMQERPKNKIGIYADQLLERYGTGAQADDQHAGDGPVHIEHSKELPR